MAEPEPRAPEAQTRTSRTPNRETPGAEAPAERRAFETGAEAAQRTVEAGAEAGRAASTGVRRFAETGSRAMDRGVDLWRQTMFPLATLPFEMNRWVDEFWRHAMPALASPSPFAGSGANLMQGMMGLPMSDLHETPEGYHILVELAGLRPEDLEVLQDGDAILVRGEKRDEHREERGGYRVNERRFGHFERRFHLPRDADREDIRAAFGNGLLEILVARRPEHGGDGRRRIEVKTDGSEVRGQSQPRRG
jgi:HSP20 family protein